MKLFAPLRYLTRPLQLEAALLIVSCNVLLAIVARAGLFGLPLGIIVISWFLKYAFVLMDHIADGKPGGPVLSMEMANPFGEARPWIYLAAIIVFASLTAMLRPTMAETWLGLLRALGIAVLPAIIATHSMSGSLLEALKPKAIAGVIWHMGWSYVSVLMVAILCSLALRWVALGPSSTEDPLIQVLTLQPLPTFLRTMVLMYLWLAMFAVLGGVLFDERDAIGFEATHAPERIQARADAERDYFRNRFIDRVFGEYRSGAYINAWNSIQTRVNESDDALAEYRWLYERVTTWPNSRLANRMAQEMLPLLFAKRLFSESLRLVKSRLQSDAEFRPVSSEQLLMLSQLARDGGDRPLARALLKDFERHFPDDPARNTAAQLTVQLSR